MIAKAVKNPPESGRNVPAPASPQCLRSRIVDARPCLILLAVCKLRRELRSALPRVETHRERSRTSRSRRQFLTIPHWGWRRRRGFPTRTSAPSWGCGSFHSRLRLMVGRPKGRVVLNRQFLFGLRQRIIVPGELRDFCERRRSIVIGRYHSAFTPPATSEPLLAGNAADGKGYDSEALKRDFLLAFGTNPVRALLDATKSLVDKPKPNLGLIDQIRMGFHGDG